MLEMEYDLTELKGASYNPRKIGEEDLALLQQSIRTLGMVKPLIARGKLLVAGHQRTKALLAMGVTKGPVYLLPRKVSTYDEVRFNQLHNGTDLDRGDEQGRIEGGVELGFQVVPHSRLRGDLLASGAPLRRMIAELIERYGPWGAVVATVDGEVLHCGQYLLAAIMTGTPVTVYGVPRERAEEYRNALGRPYGVFHYDNIERESYVQTYAQPKRLRNKHWTQDTLGVLYVEQVMPWLKGRKELVGIDFGSGFGDVSRRLRQEGYRLRDVELFRRVAASDVLDQAAIHRMIDDMLRGLRTGGYDYVVCDSVLNSVDSRQAEGAVMGVLNVLAKPGATVFISGRKREWVTQILKTRRSTTRARNIEFLDEHGWTALYRMGRWFFQKYHDGPEVEALCPRFGFRIVHHERKHANSWQATLVKERELSVEEAEAACRFEFDMPLSPTARIGRGDEVAAVARVVVTNREGALADAI